MDTILDHSQIALFRHPLQFGGGASSQQKSRSPKEEFAAELTLLSHQGSYLDHIELTVLERYDWQPSLTKVIGSVPIPSFHDIYTAWVKEMDDWYMGDSAQYMQFDQVLHAPWCRYKHKDTLIRFLRRVDIPVRYLEQELITRRAFQKALEIGDIRRREEQKRRMRRKRHHNVAN
jgi:hypothetical protein